MNFELVYQTHYDFVWRMLRRSGVGASHVEDVCQTVFLTAYRRMADFEGRSSVKTWLCGIALRVASDHRRSAAIRQERLFDPVAEDGLVSHDTQIEFRERLAELDIILAQMSPEQRTVFVLHELERFSGEEIASIEQVPLGTVRSRLRLARFAFSQILAERRGTNQKTAAGGEP